MAACEVEEGKGGEEKAAHVIGDEIGEIEDPAGECGERDAKVFEYRMESGNEIAEENDHTDQEECVEEQGDEEGAGGGAGEAGDGAREVLERQMVLGNDLLCRKRSA